MTRVNPSGYLFPVEDFRIIGVVRGQGVISIEGMDRPISQHDHFSVPAGMRAGLTQGGKRPLVVLDTVIRGLPRDAMQTERSAADR